MKTLTYIIIAPTNPERYEKEFAEQNPRDVEMIALLEINYLANSCFFKRGFILKNARRIANIPISLVHGSYDVLCPTRSAYRLERALAASGHTQVRTFYTFAGHSKSDPETQKILISETELMCKKVKAVL